MKLDLLTTDPSLKTQSSYSDSLVSPLNLCRMSLFRFATNDLQTIIFEMFINSSLMAASSFAAVEQWKRSNIPMEKKA